jgi:hypothetical protein
MVALKATQGVAVTELLRSDPLIPLQLIFSLQIHFMP